MLVDERNRLGEAYLEVDGSRAPHRLRSIGASPPLGGASGDTAGQIGRRQGPRPTRIEPPYAAIVPDQLAVTRYIAASPDAVYAAISDVTRMGEWSDECHTCEWHEGFDSPKVGATFDGHNRNGDKNWTTQGKVVETDPGRAFTFECSAGDVHYSTWGYRIEPTDGGCRVTEWTENLLPETVQEYGMKIAGVEDRSGKNQEMMGTTLARLAAQLEADH
jgi:uncharacterized protein YndB with AHSA1/START domain